MAKKKLNEIEYINDPVLAEKALRLLPRWKDDFIKELKDDNKAKGLLKEAIRQFNEDGELKYFLAIVKDIVEYSNLNVTDVMKKVGMSRPTFYNIVNLKTAPTFNTIQALIGCLGGRIQFKMG
jgi:DNA-binding phage protein